MIYDATISFSVTLYFDAIRIALSVFRLGVALTKFIQLLFEPF